MTRRWINVVIMRQLPFSNLDNALSHFVWQCQKANLNDARTVVLNFPSEERNTSARLKRFISHIISDLKRK
jgi:hypothetical protein